MYMWGPTGQARMSARLRYLPLFWPVRAAVEHNLSLSQNTLISCHASLCIAMHMYIS